MRVIMTTHIGGYRNGEPWPVVGGEIDVPDHEAADLVQAGYARATSDLLTGDLTADQVRSLATPPEDLAAMDKDQLLAFAAKRDLQVSGRYGAEKLREIITAELAARSADRGAPLATNEVREQSYRPEFLGNDRAPTEAEAVIFDELDGVTPEQGLAVLRSHGATDEEIAAIGAQVAAGDIDAATAVLAATVERLANASNRTAVNFGGPNTEEGSDAGAAHDRTVDGHVDEATEAGGAGPVGDDRSDAAPGPVDLDALDKAGLIALARDRGIAVNTRQGETKIRAALAESLA